MDNDDEKKEPILCEIKYYPGCRHRRIRRSYPSTKLPVVDNEDEEDEEEEESEECQYPNCRFEKTLHDFKVARAKEMELLEERYKRQKEAENKDVVYRIMRTAGSEVRNARQVGYEHGYLKLFGRSQQLGRGSRMTIENTSQDQYKHNKELSRAWQEGLNEFYQDMQTKNPQEVEKELKVGEYGPFAPFYNKKGGKKSKRRGAQKKRKTRWSRK
jgi:hypothetical protein